MATLVYTFEKSYIDFLKENKVTPHVKGRDEDGFDFDKLAVNGTEIYTDNIVYYVADDGFEFEYYADYYEPKASIGYRNPINELIWCTYDFDNPHIASYTVEAWQSKFNKIQIIKLKESSNEIEVKGVNDVFKITQGVMRGIINSNFNIFNGQTNTDYGQYILGLIELPFKIPDELIFADDVDIKLAGHKTDFKGSLLKKDVIKIDMGSITTPKNKDNFLAYKNKTCILHLPYCDSVALENHYVIGETISIEYLISLYDGKAIINISSSKNNEVILTRNVDLNINIPFGSVTSKPNKNDPKNIELGGDNNVKNPHIEILSNDSILENGFFTIPIIDETLINECNGFVKVEEINLISNANYSEKEMIVNLLNRGVIV